MFFYLEQRVTQENGIHCLVGCYYYIEYSSLICMPVFHCIYTLFGILFILFALKVHCVDRFGIRLSVLGYVTLGSCHQNLKKSI